MKTRKSFLLAAGLVLFFCFSLSAQMIFSPQDDSDLTDSTSFDIVLPPLIGKVKADTTSPFYKHLVIFGDGNFRFENSIGKANIQHRYGRPESPSINNYFARTYSAGAYSTNDEPPLVSAGPILAPAAGVIKNVTVVDSNRYLKILRNVQVKPGAPFVSIIAVKNPTNTTFRGQLYFMYNGRLRTIAKKTVTKQPEFSQFTIRENLFYQFIEQAATYHYTAQGSLDSAFNNMLLIDLPDLAPQEEFHFFIDMVGDASMMNVFSSTEKAEMDFAATLSSRVDTFPVLIPDSLQAALGTLELPDYLSNLVSNQTQAPPILPDSIVYFLQSVDSTETGDSVFPPFVGTGNIVDHYVSTASLVKTHDPNFMLMEACACPAKADRYQIFTTVQCENTGYGPTTNIFMDIKLPTGISADDIVVKPISYHPSNGPSDPISMIKLADDSIRWQLLGFEIEGTPLHGVGDYRTYANVQFNMYSSVVPSSLDSIYACIRFDTLSSTPVCTVPVAVSLINSDSTNGEFLSCSTGECSDDPDPGHSWPWWVWLLLLLLILLIIIWLIRRN